MFINNLRQIVQRFPQMTNVIACSLAQVKFLKTAPDSKDQFQIS